MIRLNWPTFSRACTPWVLALMLLVSLVPTLSRAMGLSALPPAAGMEAGPSRAGWVEVCGAGGVRWVQLDLAASAVQPADADVPPRPMGHLSDLDHCALCGLALDRCLPSDAAAWSAPETPPFVSWTAGPTPPLFWPHARPRATGPPFLI